jgi:hypothetical protein
MESRYFKQKLQDEHISTKVSTIFLKHEVKLQEVIDLDPKVQSIISSQQTNTTDNNHRKCKFKHIILRLREQF